MPKIVPTASQINPKMNTIQKSEKYKEYEIFRKAIVKIDRELAQFQERRKSTIDHETNQTDDSNPFSTTISTQYGNFKIEKNS